MTAEPDETPHDVEISEPGLEARDPETPDFPYGARCTNGECGWHSDTSTKRDSVLKAARAHSREHGAKVLNPRQADA